MILSWFDATEANMFGVRLAEALIERTPADGTVGKRRVTKKHEAMLHHLDQQVAHFKATHKLNVYKKAQLGNKFKWTLKDRGYDVDYVNQLTSWLMLKL
jgi:hypothetical protein